MGVIGAIGATGAVGTMGAAGGTARHISSVRGPMCLKGYARFECYFI